ncbi:MAG: hypothetical protein PHU46_11015 [Rhodocyclaceae bacterium]|nr:hypothetical protein [Rhodocyclaceae bacterium]
MWWLKQIISIPSALLQMVITYLPGDVGNVLRSRYWRKRLGFLGQGAIIDVGVHFVNPEYIEIGDNCWIDRHVMILAGIDKSRREKVVRTCDGFQGKSGFVHIGRNIHVATGCILSGIDAGIFVDDDCGFSAGCRVYAFSHHYRSKAHPEDRTFSFGPMVRQESQCLVSGPVHIGRNTGVALNVVILPGVYVSEECFIAPNSILNGGRFKPNTIISGSPAKASTPRFGN